MSQPLTNPDRATGKPRLLYVDNLRIALISLVVVGHMAITYGAPIGDWYLAEEGEVASAFAILAAFLLGIGASFLLGLFYLIAGYFTPQPFDRKGAGPFLLDRLKRLGIPLVFYALVINPLVTYWAALHDGYEGSVWRFAGERMADLTQASVGPLWFVEGLLIFSVLYALGRLVAMRVSTRGLGGAPAAGVPRNRSMALFAVALGLLTFVVRIWAPVGWSWEPPHLELAHFPQYILMFVVGLAAYRGDWLTALSAAQARPWRWVALLFVLLLPLLYFAALTTSGELSTAPAGGLTWLSLAYSLWEGVMCVAMSLTVLVWFRSRFNRQGRLARAMSGASFAVYVLHPLLIVPLAIALGGLRMDLALKFVLVAPVAVVLCFVAGTLIRKLPLVRGVL
jgi:fucose 4-O-acetylase-like acetyltransferase